MVRSIQGKLGVVVIVRFSQYQGGWRCHCVLGLQANLKETSVVKIACQVEATRIRSCS
jgi:hypothetical protein